MDSVGGLQIEVLDYNTNEKLGTFVSEEDGFYCVRVPARAKYKFFINPPSSPDAHFVVIIPPESKEDILFMEQYINLVKEKKSNECHMVIKNMFGNEMKIELRERAN